MEGIIFSINIADVKKAPKRQMDKGCLIEGEGLEGDAYNKPGSKQISITSIENLRNQKECPRINITSPERTGPGDFSETLTLKDIDIAKLKIGDILLIGNIAEIKITERGMRCWKFCPWGRDEGECPVPKDFLFAEVIKSGVIRKGDCVKVQDLYPE